MVIRTLRVWGDACRRAVPARSVSLGKVDGLIGFVEVVHQDESKFVAYFNL